MAAAMRVCIAYDCLYPLTVGGAERWYRALAERLAASGHEVTYLTLRQWKPGDEPDLSGVEVIAIGPGIGLYAGSGRRRILPALLFAAGVFRHLIPQGSRYDVVHTFGQHLAVLAAAAARRRGRYCLVVDWFEVWTREYWREYLGRVGGWIGWRLQRAAARASDRALSFSHLHGGRLRTLGVRAEIHVVEGLVPGELEAAEPVASRPVVFYAGRHIPEKGVPALVPALVRARERVPELRAEIYGDGPDRAHVLELIGEHALDGAVEAPGFVSRERLEGALATALCLVLPSRREGYGLVVVEAASRGVPSVVVRHPDNAAVELVEDGENGVIAPSANAADLADAILRVHEAGPALRASTAAWFARNARRLSLEGSLESVLEAYRSCVSA
jgi:glycosyltransferase involved in cell wall biosynthesis